MIIFKIIASLACVIIIMAGCLDNNTGPEVITEPTSKSEYYIANQSAANLKVTYKVAFLPVDSTVAVPADSTIRIFESSDVGGYPFPSSAFANIRFYQQANNESALFRIIEPIVDDEWDRTVKPDTGAIFTFTIKRQDIQ